MRKLSILSLLSLALIVLVASCKKDDDPKFSSAEGRWTYTIPEGQVTAEFTIVKSGTSIELKDPSMIVEGVTADAAIVTSNVTATTIGQIMINANDADVDYAYLMVFTDATISNDFKQIKASSLSYEWPHGSTKSATNVIITRK
jgi:hypothetical protein